MTQHYAKIADKKVSADMRTLKGKYNRNNDYIKMIESYIYKGAPELAAFICNS